MGFFYGLFSTLHLYKNFIMKKLIIVLAVGMVASNGMAQTGKKNISTPPPPQEIKEDMLKIAQAHFPAGDSPPGSNS